MKKISFAAGFIMLIVMTLVYQQTATQAQSRQLTVPSSTKLFAPWIGKPLPTSTPTATSTPSPTVTPTPTATQMPSVTTLPTPSSDAYFNIAVLQSCEPNAGITYVQGTTYVNGAPQSGYLVAFSYAADGPIVAFIQSGPHGGYEGWSPGFYSHILQTNGPREGDWYFWIMDESRKRISAIGFVHTDGEAGPGKCQQAVIDFDSRSSLNELSTATPVLAATPTPTPTGPSDGEVNFRLIEQYLWDVVDNGDWLDGSSVHCGEKHELHVDVYDATGRLLNGVSVLGIWTNEIGVTGDQGKGDGTVEFVLWGSGEDVKVVSTANDAAVGSDVAVGNTTRPNEIENEQLIQARYCHDEQSCQAFKDTFGCNGHFSWTVKFQQQGK